MTQDGAPIRRSSPSTGVAGVRWAAAVVAVVTLVGAGALVWYERHMMIQGAIATSDRRAGRLVTELAQTLDIGRVVIDGHEAHLARATSGDAALAAVQSTLAEQAPVLAALPLPVAVRPVLDDAQAVPAEPRWHSQPTRREGELLVVPFVRPAAPNAHGVRGWSVTLDHAALLRRFEASRLPEGGSAALFRIDADGATTLLARAPFDPAELGRTVRGPLAAAVSSAPRGHFNTLTRLDQVRRLVAYQRVDADGAALVMAYGVATDTLLAPWVKLLPWVAAVLLVLLGAIAAGTRRLTRSLGVQARQRDALARSEQGLREAQQLAALGSWELDLKSGALTWSDEVFAIFEIDPARFAASYEAFLAAIHPEDRDAVDQAYRRSLAERRDYAITHRLRFGDGRIKHVYEQGRSFYAADGTPLRSVGTVQDITARVQAEQALRDSEERLRLALEAANQGLYDLDLRTGHAVVSPEYTRMLGWEPEDFDESNAAWRERLHPDDREAVYRVYEDYVAGRRPDYRVEFRQRMRDGGWKWILSVGRIQERDASGQPLRMLGTHTDLDAIKAAQAEQVAATRRFEKLFQAAPEGMAVSDLASGRFLQVNDAFCELFGHAREAVIGRTSLELDMWTRPQRREDILARLRAGETVHDFEGEARRRSGETIDVMFSAERIELDGRECLLLMFRDISERKRLDAALRASEQRFRLASSSGQVWEWDFTAGGMTHATELFASLGYGEVGAASQWAMFNRVVHPDDMRPMLDSLVRHLKRQGPYHVQFRATDAAGRVRWFETQGQALWDDNGRATYMAGTTFEITERREAEEQVRRLAADLEQRVQERTAQLAQSEARYRTIFETVPVSIGEEDWSGVQQRLRDLREQGVTDGPGFFATRPDFVHECLRAVKVRRLNRKALALHDVKDPALLQPGLQAFFPTSATEAQFAEELAALWAGQRLFTSKRSLPSVAGQPLRLMMTMSLPGLDDADGTALVCLVDITEIDRLNAQLDRSVARLMQVNRELETFTYSVSHDLKAPLRGIDGYSRLLLTDHQARLDDEGRRFLGHIRQATQHMGVLIDDLLAYSRLERRELTLTDVALAPLVDTALGGLRADLATAGVELDIAIDPSLRVRGDAQGIVIALRNLIDNALKFSRGRVPPRVGIQAERHGHAVRLTVQDNGVGFDMKFHDRIYSIFQRLHRAEDYPGTGIGLAIVRKAVDRMGGRVWAISQPGEGATFTIELPEATAT